MILASYRIKSSSASGQEKVIELLRSVAGPLSAQPGLVNLMIGRDILDPDIIIYQEYWRNQADLENHIASERYNVILNAIDLGKEKPDVRFLTISKVTGMEVIKRVRTKAN